MNLASATLFVELIQDRRDTAVQNARGFVKVGFGVPSVDRLADDVERATGRRPRVVAADKQRLRILQLHDPEGNILQFSSPAPP